MNKTKSLIFPVFLLFFPFLLCADGGGPLLLMFNFMLFLYGQIWIIISEFIYLLLYFKNSVKKIIILKWTVLINLLSTLLGAIVFPLLLALIGGLGFINGLQNSTLGNILLTLGTWITGDNTAYPRAVMVVTIIGFVLTYFITVFIEYKLLYKFQVKFTNKSKKEILSKSFIFNLISYSGLILFILFGYIKK